VFGIFGDPGSGKTFFAQSMATQSALNGLPVMFVNPKGGDSLYGMVDYVQNLGISAGRVSMSALEDTPGAFDPFRYAPPAIAAEIANVHILSALDDSRDGLSLSERLALGSGLKRGALNGARCVWDALEYVPGEDAERVRGLVEQQMEASSMFSLGVALRPLPRLDVDQRLTLVDFDRDLGLPEGKTPGEYSVSERIALAAVRLVIRASLEILIANRSGVLIVDEAWTFLSQSEGLASLQRISREGRSLNILPVFLTQRIADVVTKDLESYLSRVLVLKLNEKKEAETALGLPPGVHSYAILPIGYPMGKFGPTKRAPLEQIVYQDRWGEPYRAH
jgi:DNA helicase HerA-like ATPase